MGNMNKQPIDSEDVDCTIRALNNVALAKALLLQGNIEETLERLDAALSWSFPLLGIDHPMMSATSVGLASQAPLLSLEDTNRLALG